MDKLKAIFNINKKMLVFLFGIMVIGIVFGSSLPIFLDAQDKSLVSNYLSDFVAQINNGINSLFLLKNSLINNMFFSFLIWVLGISIIGVPLVLFLFFFKCFIFGFSISSIIINYGFNGLLFSFAYIFPHQVINIFVYGLLSNYSLIFSIKLTGLVFKKNNFNIKNAFNKYFKVFLFCIILNVVSSIFESFVSPVFIGFIFKLLGM